MATEFINLTGHVICLNDGRVFQPIPDAKKVLVDEKYIPTGDGNYTVDPSKVVTNLPEFKENVNIIVSRMVFDATPRKDVVAPATGADECIRWKEGDIDENGKAIPAGDRRIGQVHTVPGFLVHK